MQFDPNVPIWLQIVNAIKADIAAGRLEAGEKLPGGRDLAIRYSINPNTAARVYQELEKEALCHTRRGMGTFVTDNTERIRMLHDEIVREAVDSFLQRMQQLGVSAAEAAELIRKEEEQDA